MASSGKGDGKSNEKSSDEISGQISKLKSLRSSAKGSLTRIRNVVDSRRGTITLPDLECRLGILESYFQQFLSYQGQYEALLPDDNTSYDYRGECEEIYISAKTTIKTLIDEQKISSPTFFSNANQSIIVKAPTSSSHHKIELPTFNGKYAEYPNFIGIFNKTIHNNDCYEAIEKCNILVNSLGGLAKNAIKEFRISEENYPKILKQLNERFDNKSLMFQELITDLFDLPRITKPSSLELRHLVDNVNAIFSSMLSIGDGENIANAMIIHVVMGKLDSESRNKWEDSIDFSGLVTWSDCSKILSKRCQFLECRNSKNTSSTFQNNKGHNKPPARKSSTSLTVSSTANRVNPCAFCQKPDHRIYACTEFAKLPVHERFAKVKNIGLCINCLIRGHSVKKCQTKSKCRVCAKTHHTLLHRYADSSILTMAQNSSSDSKGTIAFDQTLSSLSCSSSSNIETFASMQQSSIKVILATALVNIRDKFGTFKQARALLDSGSQLNFISTKLAYLLGLKFEKVASNICGIGGSTSKIRYATHSIIKSRLNDFTANLDLLVLPSISAEMPDPSVRIDNWKIPKNLQLADPTFFTQQRVDLLIGANIFFDLLCIGQIKLGENLPSLQKTLLGWIVSGRYDSKNNTRARVSLPMIASLHAREDLQQINQLVKDFWKIECLENPNVKLTEEQTICRELFYNSIRTSPSGRLIVRLPFKSNYGELGSSRNVAEKRFYNLEKRLNASKTLKSQYSEFLNEYLRLDHMELVPKSCEHMVKYYLPHHCVFKLDSSTTKVRVVFDGSCKTDTNLSLNDILMVGPVVQEDLFAILLRWRCHRYALKADISKMYRQFLVDDSDSYYQCIFWREKSNESLQTYRLKTVTYGTASASYQATESLMFLATKFQETHSFGADVIRKDFYVDDLISGADSLENSKRIRNEVTFILKSAGLEIKKWFSNNPELLSEIPEHERDSLININDSSILKTLGIGWQPCIDHLRFIVDENLFGQNTISKRIVLSDMSRLYDPLGLINPIVVKMKVFMQNLWILKLEWDESLPISLYHDWHQLRGELKLLNQLRIPRYIFSQEITTRIELHGFCDASSKAYGCCIYVRSIDNFDNVYTHLLTAKSKIAPIKTQSIPRLELCAALLLANVMERVTKIVTFKVADIVLWTDSEIVLDWLSAHPSNWMVFVANRVSIIQQITENFSWKHVPTKFNAADILSRGATVSELLSSTWFAGPEFLKGDPGSWPKQKCRDGLSNTPEKRQFKKISLLTQTYENELYTLTSKFSSYNKIINIFAYIYRFINNCKHSSKEAPTIVLTPLERDRALLKIIEIVQNKHFQSEIQSLKRDQNINRKSVLKNFNPFMEEENGSCLLKVGGRLRNADISDYMKHPIFLPSSDSFVKALILHYHRTNLHAGPQALLATIRQRFWVTNGRAVVTRIVRSCVRCFKFRPKLVQQIMGDLPSSRLQPGHVFINTGVDFCGPVIVSHGVRGKRTYKAYICVFVCFTTHAVHLELVSSLTSDAFIACLKRFVARRGLCRNIYCDNATNFVGARRALQDLREEFRNQQFINKIAKWASNEGICFHHIPARCPHFGGLWEAAVKSAKYHLNRCCHQLILTYEEMITLLTQIEAILNSRPLIPNSSDPNDEKVLTPGHFLLGRPLNAIPEPLHNAAETKNESTLHRFHRISAIRQNFWSRWSREYLLGLQRRNKWTTTSKDFVNGALVLMVDDNLPPQHWSIGRIIKLHPGRDNIIRVVEIKSRDKIFKRHIHSLALLPNQEN